MANRRLDAVEYGIPEHALHLRDLLRALIDPSRLNTPDRTIDAVGYAWEPISITSGVGIGEAADFKPWMDSVLTLARGAPGALTFLWHARALLTGNESGDFNQGSLYFPLVSGPDLGNQPPSFNAVGSTPPPASTPGAWFVIKNPDGQPNVTRLLLELHANNTVWRAPLADANGTTLARPSVSAQDWVAAAPPATIDLGDGKALTITPDSGGFAITLVAENLSGPVPLGGQYSASVIVKQNQPVTFRAELGGLPLVLPPPANTKEVFGAWWRSGC